MFNELIKNKNEITRPKASEEAFRSHWRAFLEDLEYIMKLELENDSFFTYEIEVDEEKNTVFFTLSCHDQQKRSGPETSRSLEYAADFNDNPEKMILVSPETFQSDFYTVIPANAAESRIRIHMDLLKNHHSHTFENQGDCGPNPFSRGPGC